jgi:enoyl-CoA hydratase/carnithine racemase
VAKRTKGGALFEVLVTLRAGLATRVVARCATEEEAKAIARKISSERPDGVVRVMVRRTREVESPE